MEETLRDTAPYVNVNSLEPVLSVLGRIADALERIADNGGPLRPAANTRVNLETVAITLLTKHGPNAKQIAEDIGVPVTTLRRWKNFKAYYDAARADGLSRRHRGFNHGGGDIDGIDD